MNTILGNEAGTLKALLKEYIVNTFGRRGDPIAQENFLHAVWNTTSSFTKMHRDSLLIEKAVKEHRDLLARTYLILTMQYGAFTGEPDTVSVLKDFVGLLDKDFDKKEEEICAYAAQAKFPFFPGLVEVWRSIKSAYDTKYLDVSVLPRTPHLAYVLFTLNSEEPIGNRYMGAEEMFGNLAKLNGQMRTIHDIVRDSQHQGSGHTAEIFQFKRRHD